MTFLSALVALTLGNSLQAFHILLQISAGTRLLFLLRWFWWRINSASEITAMIVSFFVAVYFEFIHMHLGLPILIEWQRLVIGVAITTVGWILVALLTKPTDHQTLMQFYRKVTLGGPGWKKVIEHAVSSGETVETLKRQKWDIPTGLFGVLLGLMLIYSMLFFTGFFCIRIRFRP